jgi:pyruvate/2-oxoglutarate dehydrogenase complex dihydrolipoamide dehydrogenase (E3) component
MTTLERKKILVATGAWPRKLNIPGEQHLTRSDQFLELDRLPMLIVFVGGRYVAFRICSRTVAYTIPPLARVGMLEDDARRRYLGLICGAAGRGAVFGIQDPGGRGERPDLAFAPRWTGS